MLRNRLISTSACLMAPPDAPAGGGSSAPSSPSPAASPASGGSTPSGSSVAPGVEPPPGAPGSSVDAPSDANSDFMSIFEGPQDSPVIPGAEAPTETPAVIPATPATPVAAPAQPATPAATETPAVPAVTASGDGGQPPAGTPPASGQSPVLDPYDPASLAVAIQQNEQATVEHVAQTMFQLSQEDITALESDVVGTVPKLFAKAFVKSQVNQLMQLAQIVPEMVRRASSDLKNHTKNEDAFYSKWPQIDRAKHADLVKKFGITYRQLNPTVSRDKMIEDIGYLVMMSAGIPLTPASGTAPTAQQNGAARPVAHQPSPFTPAIPGPAATSQQPELSPIEAMFAPRE